MSNLVSPHWYYAESTRQFVDDANNGQLIQDTLQRAHEHFYNQPPGRGELGSWAHSPKALADLIKETDLRGDEVVILEARLQTRKRVDAILCGREANGSDKGMLIEMKQWSPDRCHLEPHEHPEKILLVNGQYRDSVDHPLLKVQICRDHLQEQADALIRRRRDMFFMAYAYLHNCPDLPQGWREVLFDATKFGNIEHKIHIQTQVLEKWLIKRMNDFLGHGSGMRGVERMRQLLAQE